MRGNFFLGNRKFQICDMSFLPLKPNEVKIQNQAAGICGTDIHIYHGEKGSAEASPPVVLGHEYSGIVTEIGSAVSTVRIGDRVTVDPNMYCGHCRYCRLGKKQNCDHLTAIGVNLNGGFAEYSVVPEKQVYRLNPEVSFQVGAMAEPLACCLHGIEITKIMPGDTVCIIGGGTIGLMMVQLAKLCGASLVVLSEPVERRRQIGLSLGADFSFDPQKEPLQEQLIKEAGISGVDIIIECVGRNAAVDQAFSITNKGARVLLFSVPNMKSTYQLPLFEVFQKELKIMGSFINPDSHQKAVDLINMGKVKLSQLITHQYPLEQLEEAINKQMSADSIKVQILPQLKS